VKDMATGPKYKVPFRRRREGRTDYRRRLKLLQSGEVRAVVRKSNRNVTVQFVSFDGPGDRVVASAVSTELKDLGWTRSGKSTPGAYLTGLLAGRRAKGKGVESAVLDIGLREPVKGAVVFAALKGVLDAGVEIRHGDDVVPDEDRLAGKHMSEEAVTMFNATKSKIGGESDA
jgi:large subunit ribosomal protein L18